MNNEIKLTLDGADVPVDEPVLAPEAPKKEPKVNLSPAEMQQVEEFAKTIDLTNSSVILQYGVGAQKKISNFSEKTLNSVRTKDLGEVGKLLARRGHRAQEL